jgi:succinate dehydrogenase/fumarate reductase flavoprotein subunit
MTATAPGAEQRPESSPESTGGERYEHGADERPTGGPGDQPAAATSSDEAPARLLAADELQAVVSRWREIQAEFVDQPKRAMQDADALVSDLLDRLTRTFAEQREQLESRWSREETVSTEDLRQGLQRYRSFFERLLAA